MKVLVDYIGHGDLFYSMHLLFEKRLKWTLYRPNNDEKWRAQNIQTCPQNHHLHCNTNPISFEKFLDENIEVLLTTAHHNEIAFTKLQKNFKPKSIFIRHIANIHEKPQTCKNILLSTLEPMASNINWIKYLPEHKETFNPGKLFIPEKKIKSFSNYLMTYIKDFETWQKFQTDLKDYQFFMHGAKGQHKTVPPIFLPNAMRDAILIWHTKAVGSCGYTARQALACGRPLVVRKSYAKHHNTLAKEYLKDGINCIDLDIRPYQESLKLIKLWTHPDKYLEKINLIIEDNKKFMNFKQEAQNIKVWIENLL